MNKIFNWTFGSIFRTLGRVICYMLIGALFTLILHKNNIKITDLLGLDVLSAKTFDTSEQYRIYKCDSHNDYENCSFTSWTNNGTATSNNTSNNVVRGFSMNFGQNETLNGGGHYRVYIAFDTSPQYPQNVQVLQNYNCFGVNSNSTSGGLDENIQSCELLSTIPTSTGVTYIFDVVPAINIKSIKVNIYLNTGAPFTSVKGLSKSNLSNDTSTSDAINNMSDDLINNQNSNTQQIIDNQNQLMGSQCENLLNLTNYTFGYINSSTGDIQSNVNNITFTDYIEVFPNTYYTFSLASDVNNLFIGEYDSSKGWIQRTTAYNNNKLIITTGNTKYLRVGFNIDNTAITFQKAKNIKPMLNITNKVKPYCEYGSYVSKLDDTNNNLSDINSSLNDDDSTGAQNKASDFFGNFTTNTHGLTGIITAPLNAIQSLASSTCSPLVLPLPFVNQNLTLPCMRQIYVDNFGSFMTLYDIITLGIISYWIMVRIFTLVKDFKNPDHDEIEVMDL